ncbi:hypothetical protein B0H11DRAFT_2256814 [Mycena galericulata]|nr:hypothetical protein B0H11DRAFT_2256814 [Mycena galericulata]
MSFILPWGCLTSVTILRLQVPHELAEILRSTPKIVKCFVDIVSSSDVEIMSNTLDVPPLLHLRSLSLTNFAEAYSRSQMQILEKLTLPVLEELRISERSFPLAIDPVISIRNLLARSGCPVKSLHIHIDEAKLSRAYYRAALPSVGHIHVLNIDDSNDESGASEA